MTADELDEVVASLYRVGGGYDLVAACVERDNRPHVTMPLLDDASDAQHTSALFSTAGIVGTDFWRMSRDGDPIGLGLHRRHYSRRRYADGRKPALFVGPGEKLVLIGHDDNALFVWRRFVSRAGEQGVNCAIFRNESRHLSSAMILDAERWAADRWPGERFYTYVDPSRVRSSNPGYCFKRAGWRSCGRTKIRRLIILEKGAPDAR